MPLTGMEAEPFSLRADVLATEPNGLGLKKLLPSAVPLPLGQEQSQGRGPQVSAALESPKPRRTWCGTVHVSVLEDDGQGAAIAVDVQALGGQRGHGAQVLRAAQVQGQLAVGLHPGGGKARGHPKALQACPWPPAPCSQECPAPSDLVVCRPATPAPKHATRPSWDSCGKGQHVLGDAGSARQGTRRGEDPICHPLTFLSRFSFVL